MEKESRSFFEDIQRYMRGEISKSKFTSLVEKSVKEETYEDQHEDVYKIAEYSRKFTPLEGRKLVKALDALIYTDNPEESGFPSYERGSLFLKDRYTKVSKTSLLALKTLHEIAFRSPKRNVEKDVVTGERSQWGHDTDFVKDFYKHDIDAYSYKYFGESMEYALSKDYNRVASELEDKQYDKLKTLRERILTQKCRREKGGADAKVSGLAVNDELLKIHDSIGTITPEKAKTLSPIIKEAILEKRKHKK